MRKEIFTILALGVIFLFSGCNLDKLKDPIIVANVQKEFYIDLWETLDPDERNFYFNIETIKDQDCLNYSILLDFQSSYRSLKISLNDIVEPVDCNEGIAPAKATINAGALEPGVYNFSVVLKNTIENKGQLTITNDYYNINMETEDGISFLHKELRRVPPQTIWGYVTYEQDDDLGIADGFIADLATVSGSKTFASGYYGYFMLNNSAEQVLITNRPEGAKVRSFLFNYEGAKEDLILMAENFRSENTESIGLKLFTAEGEEL